MLGPQYSAKSGLLVPDDTRLSLGVKIVEVTEQKVPATLDVQLRVYQAGKNSLLASATVTPEEAKQLKRGQEVRAGANGASLIGSVTGVNDQLQKVTGMAEVLVEFGHPSGAPVGVFLPARIDLDSAATDGAPRRDGAMRGAHGHVR